MACNFKIEGLFVSQDINLNGNNNIKYSAFFEVFRF